MILFSTQWVRETKSFCVFVFIVFCRVLCFLSVKAVSQRLAVVAAKVKLVVRRPFGCPNHVLAAGLLGLVLLTVALDIVTSIGLGEGNQLARVVGLGDGDDGDLRGPVQQVESPVLDLRTVASGLQGDEPGAVVERSEGDEGVGGRHCVFVGGLWGARVLRCAVGRGTKSSEEERT